MFNKTQYKLLIEDYMLKYGVSYIEAKKQLFILHKLDELTKEDIIEFFIYLCYSIYGCS